MKVTTNVHNQAMPIYPTNVAAKLKEAGEAVFRVDETNETASIESSADLKELDVRNATFEEVIDMSNALYEAGKISLKEHAVLTFDYGRAANNLKRYAPGYIPVGFDMYETVSDPHGRRDWIAEFKARAARDLKFGNLVGHQSNMKILEILERRLY